MKTNEFYYKLSIKPRLKKPVSAKFANQTNESCPLPPTCRRTAEAGAEDAGELA
jgi:hypothetical protein